MHSNNCLPKIVPNARIAANNIEFQNNDAIMTPSQPTNHDRGTPLPPTPHPTPSSIQTRQCVI